MLGFAGHPYAPAKFADSENFLSMQVLSVPSENFFDIYLPLKTDYLREP